jgi:TfoX/Sxy family transcriptional regulator of competence genes
MKSNAEKAEALFQSVAKKYGGPSDAPPRRGFGSDALKVNGKIFAALSNGRLLLKLPRERVGALVTAKLAERFSTGAGRPKKEWVTIAPSTTADWLRLSDEARQYVNSQSK